MTQTQYINLIKSELNLGTTISDETLDIYWEMFESKSTISDYLRYLWVKRQAVLYLIGMSFNAVDINIGFDALKKSQKYIHLRQLLDILNAEISLHDSSVSKTRIAVSIPVTEMPEMGAVRWTNLEQYIYGEDFIGEVEV